MEWQSGTYFFFALTLFYNINYLTFSLEKQVTWTEQFAVL
jgi:hypothetical protein